MDVATQEPFGSLVRRYRRDAELTQEALAERAGLSVRAIRAIETGRQRCPRLDTVQLLAAALGVPADEQGAFLQAVAGSGRVVIPDHTAEPASLGGCVAVPMNQQLPTGGFAGSLPMGPLVGRESEVALMFHAGDAVAHGEGRLILVAGEPGVGKTRLIQEVTVAVRERGFLVAAGRCYEPEQAVPYYPFLDAAAALWAVAPAEIRIDATSRWPHLGVLLPEALPLPPASASPGQDEQQRVFRAVTGFLDAMTRIAPIALLLDDLHWADGSSLKLLRHIASHTRSARLLLLGSYRDVEVGRQHPLEGMLRDLHRDGLDVRVDVRRLDQGGTAAMVAVTMGVETVSAEFAALVHGRTEGNPFFVQHVLQALVERGDLFQRDGKWDRRAIEEIEVPESVRSVIGQRLSRLSDATQEVLQEASILGQGFRFDDLLAISEREEGELEGALEEATQAGLIREFGRDAYSFDHALTQQAIHAELSSRRRRRLHLSAGEALAHLPERRRPGRVAEIAWHFLQGDDAERALPWALRAGDTAAVVFAYSDAEQQYRTAAGLARELQDAVAEVGALEKLGDVLYRAGRYEDAVEPLDRATGSAERLEDHERSLRLIGRLAEAYSLSGQAAEGIDRVLQTVQRLEADGLTDPPSSSVADLYAALSMLYWQSGRWQHLLETAESAVSLAESTGNLRALCLAEICRGCGLSVANRVAEKRQAFERAAEAAERLGDEYWISFALLHLANAYLSVDDFEQGEYYLRHAIDIAERAAIMDYAAIYHSVLSRVCVDRGRWVEARAEAARAVEEGRLLGRRMGETYPLWALGRVLLLQGEQDGALQHLNDALALATEYRDLQGISAAQPLLALHEVREGRPQDAIARMETVLEQYCEVGHEWYPPVYAWALLDLGDEERAAEVLSAARQRAMESTTRAELPDVLLQCARLAARQGRWEDAAHDLEEGLGITQEIGLPYDQALLLCEYGQMHATKGEPELARDRLGQALTIFQRLGAVPDVERAEHLLAELGAE